MLNGNQRLMYCGLLRSIHGGEFEPVCEKPQALLPDPGSPLDGRKQKAPPGGAGLSWRSVAPGKDYLAGALDVSVGLFDAEDDDVDFLCFL